MAEKWIDEIPDLVKITEGKHTFVIKAEPSVVTNRWGKKALRVETDKGVVMIGSYAILRALKEYFRANGTLVGAKLTFNAVGEGLARRYTGIKVTKA